MTCQPGTDTHEMASLIFDRPTSGADHSRECFRDPFMPTAMICLLRQLSWPYFWGIMVDESSQMLGNLRPIAPGMALDGSQAEFSHLDLYSRRWPGSRAGSAFTCSTASGSAPTIDGPRAHLPFLGRSAPMRMTFCSGSRKQPLGGGAMASRMSVRIARSWNLTSGAH